MHIEKKILRKIFYGVIACIVVYWLLHETDKVSSVLSFIRKVLAPFVVGAAIAFILNVPMRFFENLFKGIKKFNTRRVLALLSTILSFLFVLTLVFVLLIPQMIEAVENLSPQLMTFFGKVEEKINSLLQENPEMLEWATNVGLVGFDWSELAKKLLEFLGTSLSTIMSSTFTAISAVSSFLVNMVIGVVFAVYCLFQKDTLARQARKLLYALFPEKASDRTVEIMRMSYSTFANFLSGQCIEVLILGCMFAVSMAIFGMPYIPLVSVLIAVTAFVPIVGSFVGCFIGAFLILVNDPVQAVGFVAMFLVIQQIEGNLIYPRVVGTSIGLSGMWVLFAVTVGGTMFGIVGMVLMIPVASVFYTLIREFTNKRLSVLGIDPEKLKPQPPELRSRISEKRESWMKKKILAKLKNVKKIENKLKRK